MGDRIDRLDHIAKIGQLHHSRGRNPERCDGAQRAHQTCREHDAPSPGQGEARAMTKGKLPRSQNQDLVARKDKRTGG
jgi:hypothetical protein